MPRSDNDSQLDLLRKRDPRSIGQFVRHHLVWMIPVARRLLNDDALAEDVVQNSFAKIFDGLQGFENRSSLKTWMHRITVNECLMVMRTRKKIKEEPLDEFLPEYLDNGCRIEEHWPVTPNPEEMLQRNDAKKLVLDAIDRLPEEYRAILVLRDIEELSTEETANALQLSKVNVKVRLHRARSALKKILEPVLRRNET